MAKARIIVSLTKSKDRNIAHIAQELEARGMAVDEQMPILRRISGTVEESRIRDLESVQGVEKARKEETFKIQ